MSKRGASPSRPHGRTHAKIWSSYLENLRVILRKYAKWWSQPGSNRRPQACKASALPTELWPRPIMMVGRVGVEPTTSRLSGVRSNHLSYRPPYLPGRRDSRGRREPAQAYISCEMISRMKGHEDGGIVLWTGGSSSGDELRRFPP